MELSAAPVAGTPAPYGRACSNCARAKAKCIAGNAVGAKCGRCLRLNKDCQPMETVRRRRTINKPSATKNQKLEEKLDGLFKLLQSSTSAAPTADLAAAASTASTPAQPSPESLESHIATPKDAEDYGTQRLNASRPSLNGVRLNSPTIAPDAAYVTSGTRSTIYQCLDLSAISGLEPSPDEAEEILGSFRPHMATYFPFIIIPESTTAQELRRYRPFLWLCIMSVASKSTAQQKALAKEIKITLGREVFVEGNNNIDLLLGIMVFVAWGQYHVHDKPIIASTIQLALAMVGNLGLNKPPPKEPPQMMLNLDARGCPVKPFSPSVRTAEERRAILGCFTLSSAMSSYFQRLDALRWTPYLDECMAVLDEKDEYPTDQLLIHLVKLQLVVEKAGQAPWHEERDDPNGSVRVPPIFYLKALQAQLQDFKTRIPPSIQGNEVLLLYIYSTEFKVHEIVLTKGSLDISGRGFQRLDSLYACLHATNKWFDLFLSLSPASYVGFTMPIYTQMAFCILALYRLATFDDPVWDRGLVRDTADLSLILERLIEKFAQVKTAANLDPGTSEDKDMFSANARTLKAIKTWWDAKVAAELNDNNMGLNETLGEMNMDFLDDVWLRDIFGQGGEGQFDLNIQ